MRRVVIPRMGGPDVLAVEEHAEAPTPSTGRVTIDVAYAGVTFADVMYRRGTVGLPLPLTPGLEVSGRIRAVGAGVHHLVPGQPVVGLTIIDAGGYAEVVEVDARLVAPLPSDDEELLVTAAGIPVNTTTAVLALTRAGRIAPGEVVLVHAAASGLGNQLGQVAATLRPKHLIGTVGSTTKADAARGFGYDTILARNEWLRDPGATPRPDLIIDPVGGPARQVGLDVLGPDGRLVVVGNASDDPQLAVGTNDLFFTSRTIAGFSLGALSADRPDLAGAALQQAVDLTVAGPVRVEVNTVLPLEQAVQAHHRVESGTTIGKTVLAVS